MPRKAIEDGGSAGQKAEPEPEPMPANPVRHGPPPLPWSFALFAILSTAAIVGLALAAPIVVDGVAGSIATSMGWQSWTPDASLVTWTHLLSFQFAVLGLTFIMVSVAAGRGPPLGLVAPCDRWSWLQPFILTVTVSAITAAIAFTFFAEAVARDLAPIRRLVEGGPLLLAFVALAIGAPLAEEVLFRGFLLRRLAETRLGFWGGALLANIGWTALHVDYSWLSLADVFLAGLLFSWALWRTQSLWVPIAFHAIYNALVFAILLIPTHSPTGLALIGP